MKAAIYARYSSDKQRETSIEDQNRRCREYARRQGWDIVLEESDPAVSGASMQNRPGLRKVLDAMESWDVLLVFEFARLSRDTADMALIRRRLKETRKTAVEASTGLDAFNIGSKVLGVMNEEYLVKLGFGTEPVSNAPDAAKRIVIVPERAEVVRRIFGMRAEGFGHRAIAQALNREGIPSPRGRGWAQSAVYELLRNEAYRGEFIWNRSQWIKYEDERTGKVKRRRFERPKEEWIMHKDEGLRVISENLWKAVRETAERSRRGQRRTTGGKLAGPRAGHRHPGSDRLLGGSSGEPAVWTRPIMPDCRVPVPGGWRTLRESRDRAPSHASAQEASPVLPRCDPRVSLAYNSSY
jgi:hypothetical protein